MLASPKLLLKMGEEIPQQPKYTHAFLKIHTHFDSNLSTHLGYNAGIIKKQEEF